MLDDESDNDGSDSRSSGTCTLIFQFDESVGCVRDSVGPVEDSVGRVSDVGYEFLSWQELSQLVTLFHW